MKTKSIIAITALTIGGYYFTQTKLFHDLSVALIAILTGGVGI